MNNQSIVSDVGNASNMTKYKRTLTKKSLSKIDLNFKMEQQLMRLESATKTLAS